MIREFGTLAFGFLKDSGTRNLKIANESTDGRAGQITQAGNNFLRWKLDSGVLEAVVGDLELRPDAKIPPQENRPSADDPSRPFDVEVDPEILARFLRSLDLSKAR